MDSSSSEVQEESEYEEELEEEAEEEESEEVYSSDEEWEDEDLDGVRNTEWTYGAIGLDGLAIPPPPPASGGAENATGTSLMTYSFDELTPAQVEERLRLQAEIRALGGYEVVGGSSAVDSMVFDPVAAQSAQDLGFGVSSGSRSRASMRGRRRGSRGRGRPATRRDPALRTTMLPQVRKLLTAAQALIEQEQFEEARAQLYHIVRLSSNNAEPYLELAAVHSLLDEPVKALEALIAAATLTDRDAHLWLRCGRMARDMDKRKDAATYMSKALRYAKGKDPQLAAAILYERALLYDCAPHPLADLRKTVDGLTQVLKLQPNNENAAKVLATMYHRMGDPEKAIAVLERQRRLQRDAWRRSVTEGSADTQTAAPIDAHLINLLMELYMENAQHHSAVRVAEESGVLDEDPVPIDIQANYAVSMARAGRSAAAKPLFQDLLETDIEEFGDLHLEIAKALVDIDEYEFALDVTRKLLQHEKFAGWPQVWRLHSHSLKELGQVRDAIAGYAKALSLEPAHTAARLALLRIYRETGDLTMALQAGEGQFAHGGSHGSVETNQSSQVKESSQLRRALEIRLSVETAVCVFDMLEQDASNELALARFDSTLRTVLELFESDINPLYNSRQRSGILTSALDAEFDFREGFVDQEKKKRKAVDGDNRTSAQAYTRLTLMGVCGLDLYWNLARSLIRALTEKYEFQAAQRVIHRILSYATYTHNRIMRHKKRVGENVDDGADADQPESDFFQSMERSKTIDSGLVFSCIEECKFTLLALMFLSGDYDGAGAEAKSVLSTRPFHVAAWSLYNQYLQHVGFDHSNQKFVQRLAQKTEGVAAFTAGWAHRSLSGGFLQPAIRGYLNALRSTPEDDPTQNEALLYLCLGVAHLHTILARTTHDRHPATTKAFAFFCEYQHRREGPAPREVAYNMGRAFQQLDLEYLAIECYCKVLDLNIDRDIAEQLDVTAPPLPMQREAAYNLSMIYRKAGSVELARAISHRFILF